MAQITITDEHYQALTALAQAHGLTPDAFVDGIIEEQLIVADQRAFWGKDIDTRIHAILQESEQNPSIALSDEDFLADLRARLKAVDDADA